MAYANIEDFSHQQLADYLATSVGIRSEAVSAFQTNLINGVTFLSMSEDDIKDLLPVIGDRILIRNLLKKLREVDSLIAILACYPTVAIAIYNFQLRIYV